MDDTTPRLALSGKHGGGRFALVDAHLLPELSAHSWYVHNKGYVYRKIKHIDETGRKTGRNVYLHREVLMLTGCELSGLQVDHINLDKLDNRRSNLRLCTHGQNQMNRTAQRGCVSRFKGVTLRTDTGRWEASIQLSGERKYLGCYATESEAARAYNEAAGRLHGRFARLNPIL